MPNDSISSTPAPEPCGVGPVRHAGRIQPRHSWGVGRGLSSSRREGGLGPMARRILRWLHPQIHSRFGGQECCRMVAYSNSIQPANGAIRLCELLSRAGVKVAATTTLDAAVVKALLRRLGWDQHPYAWSRSACDLVIAWRNVRACRCQASGLPGMCSRLDNRRHPRSSVRPRTSVDLSRRDRHGPRGRNCTNPAPFIRDGVS